MKQLSDMTDQEFYDHLITKYGMRWMLVSLTPEELERCPTISDEDIKDALEEGKKDRDAFVKGAW